MHKDKKYSIECQTENKGNVISVGVSCLRPMYFE